MGEKSHGNVLGTIFSFKLIHISCIGILIIYNTVHSFVFCGICWQKEKYNLYLGGRVRSDEMVKTGGVTDTVNTGCLYPDERLWQTSTHRCLCMNTVTPQHYIWLNMLTLQEQLQLWRSSSIRYICLLSCLHADVCALTFSTQVSVCLSQLAGKEDQYLVFLHTSLVRVLSEMLWQAPAGLTAQKGQKGYVHNAHVCSFNYKLALIVGEQRYTSHCQGVYALFHLLGKQWN